MDRSRRRSSTSSSDRLTAAGRWRLAWLIPRLLVLAFLADAGLRLSPVDGLTFRAWEAMVRYRAPGAPFEPSRRFDRAATYGDLAAMGNLPELRQHRRERFTTDALGFRNHPRLGARPLAAIVVGDSFAVGSGVNDDETLPAQLGALLGCGVYNAGGIDPDPDRIVALARRVGLDRGLVIHEYNEDFEMPELPSEGRRRYRDTIASLTPGLGRWVAVARGLATVSPLRVFCERAVKSLENGRLLPNPHTARVVLRTLRGGDPTLFLRAHVGRFYQDREPPVAYWRWLHAELRGAGLAFAVVLVPSKYRVYRSLLADHRRGDVPPGYLARAEAGLRDAGITVVNLTPALATEAARRLPERRYLYWLDDIHWNRGGIAVAAAAVRDGLGSRLRCPVQDPESP